MKDFIRSKLVLILSTFVMLASAVAIPLSSNIIHSHAAATSSQASWNIVPSPSPGTTNSLSAVSAYGAGNAWAVGTMIAHWNGTSWEQQNYSGAYYLFSVKALSATNVWAVGYAFEGNSTTTVFLHTTDGGNTWSTDQDSYSTSGGGYIVAIDGDSSTGDAWAVGEDSSGNALTLHLENGHFVQKSNISQNSNIELRSVSERNSSDVWAVGWHTNSSSFTMHYDGSSWTTYSSPNLDISDSNLLSGVKTIASDNAWAVGYSDGSSATGTLIHWNGSAWSTTPLTVAVGDTSNLYGITADSSNNIWAAGDVKSGNGNYTPLIWHSSDGGSTWNQEAAETVSGHDTYFSGIAIDSIDRSTWAVGGYDFSNGKTLIEHYQPSTSPPSLGVNVTVSTPGGHFISSDLSDNAALPLRIHVAYTDGSPVAGAKVHLSNPNGFLAVFNPVTDSNGNLDAPLPLPPSSLSLQSLTAGDFVSEVIATVNGKDYSSGSLTLYHAGLVDTQSGTTTQAEADNYSWNLLYYYATKPGLPCPGLNLTIQGICYVLKSIDLYAKIAQTNAEYSPKDGDTWTIQVYKYSASTMTPVYLYYESADRSGSNIFQYAKWTEDISQVQQVLNLQQQALDRTALVTKFASPVTVLAISPTGQRAGFDPNTHKFVFDYPAAISNAGDEPYQLVIPGPVQGQYMYEVTGTGNGTYTMTIQSIDGAGNGNSATTISGVAAPGITDTYLLTYSASPRQPVIVVRKIAIDIKPGQDPPAINPGSNGVTPVAIFSTPTFNATTVDPKSVKFGPNGVSPVHTSIQDVNGDGIPDLVLQFSTPQTGIAAGNTQACLTGNTTSGLGFMGCDTLQTVPH